MQPRIKFGLIVGAIGLVLNVCVSAFIGICGPFATLIAGGVAGYLAAQAEKAPTKGAGAQLGGLSGAIAGGLMLIGQLCGGVLALTFIQTQRIPMFGTEPPDLGDGTATVMYYAFGLGTGLCFGLIGVALGAAGGAGAGYLGTPEPTAPMPSNPM